MHSLFQSPTVLCIVLSIYFFNALFVPSVESARVRYTSPPVKQHTKLFISISSRTEQPERRQMLRDSWLRWASPNYLDEVVGPPTPPELRTGNGEVVYKFFVDKPINDSEWNVINKEMAVYDDLVFMPSTIPRGHDLELYARRGLFHLSWTIARFDFEFYLRVDDDSFLCLDKLLYELDFTPRNTFFWGKWWCNNSRARADENFMLMTQDVAQVAASGVLRVYPHTFAMNFQYWLNGWNITLFDDRDRHSAQTGIVAPYMHEKEYQPQDADKYASFCTDHLYAHHFTSPQIARAVFHATQRQLQQHTTPQQYTLPEVRGPLETCGNPKLRFFAPWLDMNSLLVDIPKRK
eukprot:TRINITY_DN356_c0_g1_i1.p1 TRINITY_DN356_c0_g1~~TRINITY_DN356_c0_g1_i1.p1  ORF type:complete len:349 (-),score=63.22 TRINITY_DN356_c0_g1_i1:67-1113(-)